MFLGVALGAGLLGAADMRFSKAALVTTYCSVVTADIWSSAAWLLGAANMRLSKLPSIFSRMSCAPPPLALVAVDEAREDAVVPLRRGRGVKHVRLVGGCSRLALQHHL